MAGGLTSGAPFPVTHLSVGRCVLERRRRGRNVSAYTLSCAALAHFNVDGVHLSPPDIRRSQPSRAGQGGCSCRGLCLLCAVLPLVGLHTCTMYCTYICVVSATFLTKLEGGYRGCLPPVWLWLVYIRGFSFRAFLPLFLRLGFFFAQKKVVLFLNITPVYSRFLRYIYIRHPVRHSKP